MSALNLMNALQAAVVDKSEVQGYCVHTEDSLGAHCFHANTLNMRMYQLLVLALQGKRRYPLVNYDGDLQTVLNKAKFFSNSLGFQFAGQRETVISDLVGGRESTMLFTSPYGLQGNPKTQKSGVRSNLWTLNFTFKNKKLYVQAVFGHCTVFPMAIYEIAGVELIAAWFAKQLGASPIIEHSWYFHKIIGNGSKEKFAPYESSRGLTAVPSAEELSETLRIEANIRSFKHKMMPTQRVPLSEELNKFLSDVHAFHVKG